MQIDILDIIVIILSLASIGLSAYVFGRLNKVINNFRKITEGVGKGNLEMLLSRSLEKSEQNTQLINNLKLDLENFVEKSKTNFQKIGFKRFNPFHETGGNQSFVLTLLDKSNNGILISSLHQRDSTRVYAKQVRGGQTKQKLSDEEKQVLENTI